MWIKFTPILQKPIKSCIFVKKLRSNEKDSLYCTDWTVNCKQYFVRHQKKFLIAENGRIEALSRGDNLQGQLNECHNEMEKMRGEIDCLQQDTTKKANSIRHYQQLLTSNMSEQEKLNALLGEKLQTIQDLQGMIDQQNAKVQNLLNSVKDALLGFTSDELTVREQNGKVYVAMSDKLLFQSGSAKLDKRGEEALGKLAEVLNKQTEIDVYIEGHTDNKPIHTSQFKDNWDLSVIRATSVVRILIEKYQVNPLQIQPCGRGEFMPVADNESAEGRAKNRRTEIIMAPKLDKLFQMLQK